MNCDQAFDLMTQRGGSANPELQTHLATCRRCREMQDTLSPAIELFAADACAEQAPWMTAESGAELAVQAAVKLTQSAPLKRPRWGIVIGYLASVLIGAGAVWGIQLLHPDSSAADPTQSLTKCAYLADSRSSEVKAQVVLQNCLACHHVERHE